jgi:hypothetical protein
MTIRQPGAPADELVARQRPAGDPLPGGICGVNLNNALCQINADSGNLGFWNFSFRRVETDMNLNLGTGCGCRKVGSPFVFLRETRDAASTRTQENRPLAQ